MPAESSIGASLPSYRSIYLLALICLPVIVFNLINVFGPHYLLHDDPYCYREGIEHMVTWYKWQVYGKLTAFTEGFSQWMSAHYSPYVVRLFYLFVYLNGISCSIYWIGRVIFNLPRSVSYLAAVPPAILPLQDNIIAGINISYTLIGTLTSLLTIIASYYYLTGRTFSLGRLLLTATLYALSTRLMEQAVFLAPAIGLIILACTNHWKRKVPLLGLMAIAAGTVLFRMITQPRPAATFTELSLVDMLGRLKVFLVYLSPFGKSWPALTTVYIFFLIGGISVYYWPSLRKRVTGQTHFSWLAENHSVHILPLFILFWTILSAMPFITVSRSIDTRMFHIAGFGPWFLGGYGVLFTVSLLCRQTSEHTRNILLCLAISVIVCSGGINHARYAQKAYKEGNYYWDALTKLVTYVDIPQNSDVVITNVNNIGTYSSIHTMSGYLSRLLGNRTDIRGFVGKEIFFYDPFAQFTQEELWSKRMTGLRKIDNLQLFRFIRKAWDQFHDDRAIVRLHYFLRVICKDSQRKNGENIGNWTLYKIEGNKAKALHRGSGIDAYINLLVQLKEQGIEPNHICWGDPSRPYGINSPLIKNGILE